MAFRYQFISPSSVRPTGWLLQQLTLQAKGLNGNLDRIWPDIRDSRWLGGDREGWERLPYWLDGFIPLAFLLDNSDMKRRAEKDIHYILDKQRDDGWICPSEGSSQQVYDVWAVFLIAKVLITYESCTREACIRPAVLRMMKNLYKQMTDGTVRLFDWGKSRWFEAMISLSALKEWYPEEPFLSDLAKLLRDQGTDYPSLKERWIRPLNQWTQETHIVNLAMMLKYEAVSADLLGETYTDKAEELWKFLYRFNGTPAGILTGDECLSGISPIQGSELCSVVEWMYSFEWLFARTGDFKWAKRLEKVAFNALPAALTDDMWAHQYDQMSNQIDCTPLHKKPIFRTNSKDAHVFGLEPCFGCCTANFGQGWPKLASSAFLRNEREICMPIPLPADCSVTVGGVPVRISVQTDYPFRRSFSCRIEAEEDTELLFRIGIPDSAESLRINGKEVRKASSVTLPIRKGVTERTVCWTASPKLRRSLSGLFYAEYGPLVFSLPLKEKVTVKEYEKDGVERKYPYCDYYLSSDDPWNFGYASDRLTVTEQEGDPDIPFSSRRPKVTLTASLSEVDWPEEDGYLTIPAKYPAHRVALDGPFEKVLYPYGCAKLRMTELPKIRKKKQ